MGVRIVAVISINYKSLEDCIKKANQTVSYLNDYTKDMDSVAKECEALGGSDPKGYVSSAAQLAREKSKQAAREKEAYSELSKQLSSLETLANDMDQAVEKNIDVTVSNYIGKKSAGQVVGDWLYARYVDFVNGVASLPGVGKHIAQGIRTAGNWISDQAISCYNYFKYGDGKYIWNGVKAVVGAVVAVATAVVAVASLITAAPVLLVVAFACAGAIASTVYAGLKIGDAIVSVGENHKAWRLSKQYQNSTKDKETWWDSSNDEGSITAARYYGSVSGVKDWIDRTDFGDKGDNEYWGKVGTTYYWTEETAKIISSVCNIAVSVGNAQYVKNVDGTWATYNSGDAIGKNGTFFQNLRTTYLDKVGYKYLSSQYIPETSGNPIIYAHDYSKAFKFKFFDGYDSKFAKAGIEVSGGVLAVFNGTKIVKNVDGLVSNIETIHEWDRSETKKIGDVYDTFEAAIDISSNLEFFDAFIGDANKGIGVLVDIGKGIAGIVSPSENAFLAYMKSAEAQQ